MGGSKIQMGLTGGQTFLSSIFCVQQRGQQKPPSLQPKYVDSHDIAIEISEVDEQIKLYIQEIWDKEDEIMGVEIEEFDLDPEAGDECVFDAVVPGLEEELQELKYDNGLEIERLELEKKELQFKLIGRGER